MTATTTAVAQPPAEVTVPAKARRRRIVTGSVLLGLGAIMIGVFALTADAGTATFGWAAHGDEGAINIPNLPMPVVPTVSAFGAVCLALGAYQLARGFGRWLPVVGSVAGFLFLVSLVEWGVAGSQASLVDLAQSSLTRSIPLVLGALSGILCERAGIINIAIEGQFLVGAFAATVTASVTGSVWLGLVMAGVAGALLAAILAVFAIRYGVSQVIVGVVLNVFALGLTNFLTDRLLVANQTRYNSAGTFSNVKVPGLSSIPIVGPLLFNVNMFLYIAIAFVVLTHLSLFKTRWGLRVRAVGEHPTAADTVGINVIATRYRNTIYGGIVAGIGGAYLTIGSGIQFSKNISSGKGFIALAAVIFGRWTPLGAVAAAILFGFSDAVQSLFQILAVPISTNLLLMAPYVATIIAVAGLVGRVRPPAAEGKPYEKQ